MGERAGRVGGVRAGRPQPTVDRARRAPRAKASSCAAFAGDAGIVGARQVGVDARPPQTAAPSAANVGEQRRRAPGWAPTRCMPVSTLTCTSQLAARRTRPRPRARRRTPSEYTVGVRPCREHLADLVGRLLAQHEDRRLDAGLSQLDAFLGERDAQPGGAGTKRLGGDRRARRGRNRRPSRPPTRRRGDDVADHTDVVIERVEVDLRPRPTAHRSRDRRSGRAPRCRRSAPSTSGSGHGSGARPPGEVGAGHGRLLEERHLATEVVGRRPRADRAEVDAVGDEPLRPVGRVAGPSRRAPRPGTCRSRSSSRITALRAAKPLSTARSVNHTICR